MGIRKLIMLFVPLIILLTSLVLASGEYGNGAYGSGVYGTGAVAETSSSSSSSSGGGGGSGSSCPPGMVFVNYKCQPIAEVQASSSPAEVEITGNVVEESAVPDEFLPQEVQQPQVPEDASSSSLLFLYLLIPAALLVAGSVAFGLRDYFQQPSEVPASPQGYAPVYVPDRKGDQVVLIPRVARVISRPKPLSEAPVFPSESRSGLFVKQEKPSAYVVGASHGKLALLPKKARIIAAPYLIKDEEIPPTEVVSLAPEEYLSPHAVREKKEEARAVLEIEKRLLQLRQAPAHSRVYVVRKKEV